MMHCFFLNLGSWMSHLFELGLQEVAEKWDVQAMPTFIFIKDKKLVHKIVGANKTELENKSKGFATPDPNA